MGEEEKLNLEVCNKINSKIEATFIEGLKIKGFEFESEKDLFSFVKENCKCVDSPHLSERVYYVNEIPFLVHYYKITMDFKYSDNIENNPFIEDFGSYSFL